jgi:ubiquinone/menaquinone biosynthesis C-methylase UbiE
MALRINTIYDHYSDPYDAILLNWSLYVELRDLHLRYLKDGHKILDHGAGTGNQTVELLKVGKEVVAIDINESMLDILKTKCSNCADNLIVHTMDAHKLVFEDREFDAVTSMNVIYNLPHPLRAIEEVFRVLKEGGLFLLSGPNPSSSEAKIDEVMNEALIPELKEKGLYDSLKEQVEQVRQVNKKLMDLPTKYSVSEISSILIRQIGFKEVVYSSDQLYWNAGHFVVVRK